MSFPDRFELLELLREGEVQTFRARERATGRSFEAHFAASQDALSEVHAVIDRGSHEGKFYVVSAPLAEPAPLNSAGAWRIKPSSQPSTQPAPASQESAPGSPPGDFTRMFQMRQAPEPVAVPAPKPMQPAPASQPGEFTRAFQKPSTAASVAPADSPAPGQPGEFTRMFQKPGAPPVPTPPDNSVPAPSEPASQPMGANSAPVRSPAVFIVIAIAVLCAIAVFVWVRRIY